MLLSPRYDGVPVIAVDVRLPGPHPLLTQRRRLGRVLSELTEEQWQRPSRCAAWRVQDVVSHLTSTNGFWALSIESGASRAPTRFLAEFDPVASPAQLAERDRGASPAEVLAAYLESTAALARVVDGLDARGWSASAEAPPGHLPVWLVADHALWDAWVHERDIVLPLGLAQVVEPDEVRTCLRYAVALGRAFALCQGDPERGAVVVRATDPDEVLLVEVDGTSVRVHAGPAVEGTPEVTGDAVELLELLSARDIGEAPPEGLAWLVSGLEQAFDQAAPR